MFEDGVVNVSRALTSRSRFIYPKVAKTSILDSLLSRRIALQKQEEKDLANKVCVYYWLIYMYPLCPVEINSAIVFADSFLKTLFIVYLCMSPHTYFFTWFIHLKYGLPPILWLFIWLCLLCSMLFTLFSNVSDIFPTVFIPFQPRIPWLNNLNRNIYIYHGSVCLDSYLQFRYRPLFWLVEEQALLIFLKFFRNLHEEFYARYIWFSLVCGMIFLNPT